MAIDIDTLRVSEYQRTINQGDPTMKKFSMLGIIGGAALLAAVPFSLQSKVGSTVPELTASQAEAATAGMQRRETRRIARQTARHTRRAVRRGTATPQ